MWFGRQGVGQLAAEAYAQGLGLQAVFRGGEGGVVIAAGLSEAVAAFVDADDGDQQQAELVDTDFLPVNWGTCNLARPRLRSCLVPSAG